MVKSIVTAELEPGYEDNMFAKLRKEPQVLEVHLTGYENEVVIFIDSKDEATAEAFTESLRDMRMVRNTTHAYVTNVAKHGFTRVDPTKRYAFLFSNLEPGAEQATMDALADCKVTRDVLALTGPYDVMVTAEIGDLPDLWTVSNEIVRNVRFVMGTQAYVSLRSMAKD